MNESTQTKPVGTYDSSGLQASATIPPTGYIIRNPDRACFWLRERESFPASDSKSMHVDVGGE